MSQTSGQGSGGDRGVAALVGSFDYALGHDREDVHDVAELRRRADVDGHVGGGDEGGVPWGVIQKSQLAGEIGGTKFAGEGGAVGKATTEHS